MSKAKLAVLIIAILLLLTGVAYARWTEQVNIQILAKTAETKLSFVDYTSRLDSGSVSVTNAEKAQATVTFKGITPATGNTVTLRFKNTGTIPIDIPKIKKLLRFPSRICIRARKQTPPSPSPTPERSLSNSAAARRNVSLRLTQPPISRCPQRMPAC